MFQTIAKNTLSAADGESRARRAITLRQSLWRIKTADGERGLTPKESWDKQWKEQQLKPAARIAYRWATFPTEQSFRPSGDYNWGMTRFDLKPGAEFDVKIVWIKDNKEKSAWLRSLKCAGDTPQE